MKCTECGEHVRLMDSDAGSDNEIYKLCNFCLDKYTKKEDSSKA